MADSIKAWEERQESGGYKKTEETPTKTVLDIMDLIDLISVEERIQVKKWLDKRGVL